MISCSSSFASSHPATSAKVIFGVSPLRSRAFDFPKLNARDPPACICRMTKSQSPMMKIQGRMEMNTLSQLLRAGSVSIVMSASRSSLMRASPISRVGSRRWKFAISVSSTVIALLRLPSTSPVPRRTWIDSMFRCVICSRNCV